MNEVFELATQAFLDYHRTIFAPYAAQHGRIDEHFYAVEQQNYRAAERLRRRRNPLNALDTPR